MSALFPFGIRSNVIRIGRFFVCSRFSTLLKSYPSTVFPCTATTLSKSATFVDSSACSTRLFSW